MRRLVALSLALAALTACGGGQSFRFAKSSCQADYVSWNGGLTWAVMQGPGDGTFDFDPPGQVEARQFGEYELATGNFVYSVSYDPHHWREESRVEGSGYVGENGDLDLVGSVRTTDVNGDSATTDVQIERTGCNETTSSIRDGHLYVTDGSYGPSGYEYTVEVDEGGENTEGTQFADLTYEESTSIEDGSYSYDGDTEGDGDGYSRTDWTQEDSTYTADGYNETFLDGSVHQSYTYEASDGSGYEWDVQVDYDGNGGGTYDDGTNACDVVYDAGACTLECGSQSYSC